MRHPMTLTLLACGALTLAGCGQPSGDAEVNRALQDVNVVDETNLNDVMLTVADPNEAVAGADEGQVLARRRIDVGELLDGRAALQPRVGRTLDRRHVPAESTRRSAGAQLDRLHKSDRTRGQ